MPLRGRNNLSDEHFFFVTTTVLNHSRVFQEDKYCDILLRVIKYYQAKYEFGILAYVIMPSHLHWVVKTLPGRGTISDIMRDIKKYSAWDLMDELAKSNYPDMQIFLNSDLPKQKRQFWDQRFDDKVVRNDDMLRAVIEYIHQNPVVAGIVELPEDYKYSSARNYLRNDDTLLAVDKSWIEL